MFGRITLIYCLLLWIGYLSKVAVTSQLTFTNVKCVSLNKHFAEVEYCRLKAIKRGVRELSAKIKVHELPMYNISVHFEFMKKSNGWQHYYRNVSLDLCKYFGGQRNPIISYIFGFVMPFTNLNHSCPYNHDIIVDRMSVDTSLLGLAPIPSGEYAFFCTWMTNNVKRVYTQLYFQFVEK